MAARTVPTFAPRAILRIGSTWGAWPTAALRRSEVAASCGHPRRREQRIAPPSKPIGEQADPFARGDVHPAQALGDLVKGPCQVSTPTRSVIHRPRLDLEVRLPERGHRTRH